MPDTNPLETISLYNEILPQRVKERLEAIRHLRTESNWEIGAMAVDATRWFKSEQEAGRLKDVYLYHLWHAFHHFSHVSPRRVEKLSRIFEAFPAEVRERYAEYDFGFFEKAFDFPVRYRMQALEFLEFFEEEHGRQLRVTEFQFLFRKHILGERPEEVLTLEGDAIDIGNEEPTPLPEPGWLTQMRLAADPRAEKRERVEAALESVKGHQIHSIDFVRNEIGGLNIEEFKVAMEGLNESMRTWAVSVDRITNSFRDAPSQYMRDIPVLNEPEIFQGIRPLITTGLDPASEEEPNT